MRMHINEWTALLLGDGAGTVRGSLPNAASAASDAAGSSTHPTSTPQLVDTVPSPLLPTSEPYTVCTTKSIPLSS